MDEVLKNYFNRSTRFFDIKPDFVVDFNENLHDNFITCFLITKNSERLISSGFDCTIKIWEIQTLKLLRTLRGHTGAVRSLALSQKNPEILFSGSNYDVIRIWNLQKYSQVGIIKTEKPWRCLVLNFESKLINVFDKKIQIWDTETHTIIKTIDKTEGIICIAVTPKYIITGVKKSI